MHSVLDQVPIKSSVRSEKTTNHFPDFLTNYVIYNLHICFFTAKITDHAYFHLFTMLYVLSTQHLSL